MTIDRSTQFFTLDGLTAFKETVIKNYAKLGTIDAYIDSVIYNAMMQYKRDIVKFVSAKNLLPGRGNPGTLYMIPKGTDDLRYKPMTNEIWVTSTGGFKTMRLYVNTTNKYVDMPKNEYGFFVLNLDEVDHPYTNKAIAFLESTETSVGTATGSTGWLYMPNVTGSDTLNVYITTYDQLYSLGGSIISVEKRDDPRMVRIPVPQSYVGDKADVVIAKNTGEIWINAPYAGDYLVCQFSTSYAVNAPRNEYGYYVLSINNLVKRRIEYLAIYKPNSANTTNIRRMDTNAYLVTKYSDLVGLVGSTIAITLDSNAYAILLSDYEQEFSETYTIPDDEIWVSSESASIYCHPSAYETGSATITEKNEYGFFVLKKGVHFPSSTADTSLNALYSTPYVGNTRGCSYAFIKEYGIFSLRGAPTSTFRRLCGHIIACPDSGDSGRNILVAIYPQDTTISNIATLAQTSGITIPSDEIWIDSANWPTLGLRAYNSNNAFAVELNKNEYGYYVLRSEDYTEYATDSAYNLRFFTLDIPLAAHDQITNSTNAKYTTGSGQLYYRKQFSNSYSYLYLQNIFSYLGGERVVLGVGESRVSVIPDELPIITYTGANGDQFVTYAYENGKYAVLGSTVFNLSDVTIDRSLDGNSLHAVQNKIIENALNTKYNVADITETIEHGNDNLVTSKAIQAALANKLDWADLKNITLYQLMRELRFPWNMPTKMYFKLVVYAPLVRQDLAIFYPTLTQRLQCWTYGGNGSFVSTDNKFTYSTYSGSRSKYIDGNTGDEIWLQNSFDLPMYSYTTVCLSGGGTSNQISNINEDMQFTITSEAPVSMSTLANLSYKFRAYSANESSTHSHLNQIYVSTYLSPDGVDWHPLQNKTVYKWDDNYEDLNDYIYLIPILA